MEDISTFIDKIRSGLDHLISHFAELQKVLIAERAALRANDHGALAAVVERKQAVLSSIHSQTKELGPTPLQSLINGMPAEHLADLEQRHSLLLQQATNAREYNAVNGKIIARSQQSLQALIALTSGAADELVYSERGEAQGNAGSTSFAQA